MGGIMKRLEVVSIPFLLVIFFMSCQSSEEPCITPSSTFKSEMRDVKDFNEVVMEFNVAADINITQSPEFSFEIYGPDNLVEMTTTTVQGEALLIDSDVCFTGESDVIIDISAPDYESVTISGVGKLSSIGNIEGDRFRIDFFGVGEVEADIYVDTLYTNMAGTGVLDYGGEVHRHIMNVSGIYTMNSYPLVTDHTFINLTGTGDSFISVNETLTVIIEGQGKIFYQGNPTIESEILGDGEIIDTN